MDSPKSATTGHLLWRLTMRWRAAVDRALAPLGLTHAHYVFLASLHALLRTGGGQPSQRELSDFTGLEPIYVSKLARTLEDAGWLARSKHRADPRAIQLGLTDRGSQVVAEAIPVVAALQEQLIAPIGGAGSPRHRDFIRTLNQLLEGSSAKDTDDKTRRNKP